MANAKLGFGGDAGFFPAGNGSVDIDFPDFGNAAVAILYTNNGRSGGADQGACRGSLGFWVASGPQQYCTTFSVANNNNTVTRGGSHLRTSHIGAWYNNTGVLGGEISCSAITDGVRLTLSNSDGAARYYNIVVLSERAVDNASLHLETPGTSYFNTGYLPSFILGAHPGTNVAADITQANRGFGACCYNDNDGNLAQRSHYLHIPTDDAPMPVTVSNYKTSQAVAVKCDENGLIWSHACTGFDNTGVYFNTDSSTDLIIYLSVSLRQKNYVSLKANNQSGGQTTKTNTNVGFVPLMSLCSTLGSGTGLESVRLTDVNTYNFWANVDNATRGGYERQNMYAAPSQTASAGNTVRNQNREYDAAGEYRTLSTTLLSDGYEWELVNTATSSVQGWIFSIGNPNGIYQGADSVPEVHLGGTPIYYVFKGGNLIHARKDVFL